MKYDICGVEVKNLGVHKYHKHRETLAPGSVIEIDHPSEIKVDEITEKPLSILISEMKGLMKAFRYEMDVRISDRGGKTSEVEIRVRIQL